MENHFSQLLKVIILLLAYVTTASPSTTPPQPDSTKTTQPGFARSTQPGSTTPTQPDSTKTTQPGSTTPPQPGSTTPPQPGSTTPPQPGATTLTQPGSTTHARSIPSSTMAPQTSDTTVVPNLSTLRPLFERTLVNVNLFIFLNTKLSDFNEKQRLEFELFKKFRETFGFSSLEIILLNQEHLRSNIIQEINFKNVGRKLRLEYNLLNLLKNGSVTVNGIEKTIPLMQNVTLNGKRIVVNTSKTLEIFQEKEKGNIFSYRNHSCTIFSSNRLCPSSDHCKNTDTTPLGFNCTHKCLINNPCSLFHKGAIWETGVCGLSQKFDAMCRCPDGTMRVAGSKGCMKQGFIVGISVTLVLLVIVSFSVAIGILLKIEKSKRKISSNHLLSGQQNMVMEYALAANSEEFGRNSKQTGFELPGQTVHA